MNIPNISNLDIIVPIAAIRVTFGVSLNVFCYPNPFRGDTTIGFKQTVNSPTTITVYNIKGQLIKTLTNQPFNSGEHDVTWDGKDDQGRSVSPGLYFYKIKSGKFCTSGKMILMK